MATPLAYPALVYFHDEMYEAMFMDIKGCSGTGSSLKDVWLDSRRSLRAYLNEQVLIPTATPLDEIRVPEGAFILMVEI